MDTITLLLIQPFLSVDDLVLLFLSCRYISNILSLPSSLSTIHSHVCSLLIPEQAQFFREHCPAPNNFPALVRDIDRCYLTKRSKRYYTKHLYDYVERAVMYGKTDIVLQSTTVSELDELSVSDTYQLMSTAIKRNQKESLLFLHHKINHHASWSLEEAARQNNLGIFRWLHQECATTVDRKAFNAFDSAIAFSTHNNVEALEFILTLPDNRNTTHVILKWALTNNSQELVNIISKRITPDYGSYLRYRKCDKGDIVYEWVGNLLY